MFIRNWLFALFCLGAACVMTSAEDRLIDTREVSVPVGALAKVQLDVEAGWLEVIGEAGREAVRLKADFVATGREADDARLLEKLEFTHRIDGSTLMVKTRTGSVSTPSGGKINLTAYIPSDLVLDIKDTSGWIRVHDMGQEVTVDDSSGDLQIDSLGGRLRIDDSSGGIEVRGVKGPLEIDDSSGDIEVRDAGSDVRIEDSSGEIDVFGVGGNLHISDSSGDIEARDIQGDFEVSRDGSGRIRHSGVRGTVRIPEKKR